MLKKLKFTALIGVMVVSNAYAVEKFSDQDIVKFQNAASRGKIAIIEEYLKKGIDVNVLGSSNDDTALMKAAKFCKLDIAKLLLSKGADKTLKDFKGKTAMDYAKSSSFHEGCKSIESEL